MIYGARHRNAPLQQRILSVKPFWTRLRTQRLSTWHKLLVIRQALLPRALFGSELTFLGLHWYVKIRSQIMRALKFDRAGANPLVRIAFACGLKTDPQYVDDWKTFSAVVSMIQSNDGVHRTYCLHPSGRRTFGPFAKFLRLLDFLDWRLLDPGTVELWPGVSCPLPSLDLRSFRSLFDYCWRQQLTLQVRHRQDFKDLDGINFSVSFAPQPSLDRSQHELLDCIRDGTFFLSTTKAKYDASVSELRPCGRALDTLEHRALSCSRMSPIHLRYLDVQRMWHFLPRVTVEHGLCPANPFQMDYWAALMSTPWTAPEWRCGPLDGSLQLLFTDGSCSHPEAPHVSLAAWSLILASREMPVGSGLLPGLVHNSGRAEIWALIMATQWLVDYGAEGIVHVDSKYACDGACFLQRNLLVPSDWCDRDLWLLLLDYIRQHSGTLIYRKVDAHLKITDDMSEQQAFEIKWNSVADLNAKVARTSGLSPVLAKVHSSLFNVHCWQKHWTLRCQSFLLELAQRNFRLTNLGTDFEIAAEFVDPPQQLYTNPREWLDLFPLNLRLFLGNSPAVCAFGLDICVQIAQWFLDLDALSDHLQTITFLEFFVGFYLDAKVDLPVRVLMQNSTERWVPVQSGHVGELMGRSLQSRLAVFKHVCCLIFELVDFHPDWTSLAVPSIGICKPLDALVIPWPRGLASRVSASLARYTATRPIRHSRDIARSWP